MALSAGRDAEAGHGRWTSSDILLVFCADLMEAGAERICCDIFTEAINSFSLKLKRRVTWDITELIFSQQRGAVPVKLAEWQPWKFNIPTAEPIASLAFFILLQLNQAGEMLLRLMRAFTFIQLSHFRGIDTEGFNILRAPGEMRRVQEGQCLRPLGENKATVPLQLGLGPDSGSWQPRRHSLCYYWPVNHPGHISLAFPCAEVYLDCKCSGGFHSPCKYLGEGSRASEAVRAGASPVPDPAHTYQMLPPPSHSPLFGVPPN